MSVEENRLARRLRLGMIGLGIVLAAMLLGAVAAGAEPFDPDHFGPGQDSRAYWEAAHVQPYQSPVGSQSAYLYSPAFLQLISPLTALPWATFAVLWAALLMIALVLLVGPVLFASILLVTWYEVWGGNITLLIALAIVAGFRWSGTWAFVVLGKITPGIGLLWFAVRREWRALAIAAAATAIVAGVSWLIAPLLWQQWIEALLSPVHTSTPAGSIPIPLWVRLPVAAAITIYAALTGRQWLVLVAAMLALPVLWYGGLTMLVGIVALRRRELEAALLSLVRSGLQRRRGDLRREPLPGR